MHNKTKAIKTVDFVFCSFTPVGFEEYARFFKKRFKDFTYLKFKFPHSKGKIKSAINGKEIFTLPGVTNKTLYFALLPINYLVLFVQSLILLWRRSPNKRIFMGVNHMCTFYGVILKKLGRFDFVIYRVTDFFPLPRSGPYRIINRIFYIIDRFCLKYADSIWFTTEGHLIGREKYGYFNRADFEYELIPLGLDVKKFVSCDISGGMRFSLVYCGVVSKYHMLDLVFDVISELKSRYPSVKLNLIGTGPDEEYFKSLAVEMGLSENIIFHGFVPEGKKFVDLMSHNILGVALYRDEEDFMKYTEPAKVKYYLSFGVPAIISNVPEIARELDKEKVAFAVDNNKLDIVKKIERFMLDVNMQREYKSNIKKFVKTIDINGLLRDKLGKTLRKFGLSDG